MKLNSIHLKKNIMEKKYRDKKLCNSNREKHVSKKDKIRAQKEEARQKFNAPPPKFCLEVRG